MNAYIIITCLGGQAGSRLAPIFAELANEMAVKCHLIVTLPFSSESLRIKKLAKNSLEILNKKTCSIKTILNQQVLNDLNKNTSLFEIFDVISQCVVNHAIKLCWQNKE